MRDFKKIPKYQNKPYVVMERCAHWDKPDTECRRLMIESRVSFRAFGAMREGIVFSNPVDVIPDALNLFDRLYEHYEGHWFIYS